MLYNYHWSYVINLLNINAAAKNLVFEIIFTKKTLIVVKLLRSLNIIHNLLIVKYPHTTHIRIFIYYFKSKRIGAGFKVISTPAKLFHVSLKALNLLDKRIGDSLFLVSTTRGVLTHQDAIKFRIGGIILGLFTF